VAQQKDSGGGLRGLVIGMVVFVVAVGVLFTVLSNKSNDHAATPSSVVKANGYGITFNANAKTQVDIWEDFQCPICQHFESINHAYIESLARGNKVKVVFHPLSFIGAESILAANAAACAADQGKFLDYHYALYLNQGTENTGHITNGWLEGLASSVGITSSKFTSCVENMNYSGWVKNIAADGARKNVNATPTVFVNGKELNRNTQYMDPAAFQAAILAAGA
jgi:protein-disulfide isomerase